MRSTTGRLAAGVGTLLLVLTAAGCGNDSPAAQGTDLTGIQITDGWVRATVGTEDPTMTAAFMDIKNFDEEPVTVTGASTPAAMKTEIHEMVMGEDGAMVMQQIQGGLVVKPDGHQHLAPGGNHIMLMGLTDELAGGDEVTLTVEFDNGDSQEVTLPVKEFTEEEGSYDHSHSPSPSS